MGETIHQPLVNVYSITLNRRDEVVVSGDLDRYSTLARKLTAAGTRFIIEPHRFQGQVGEQATLFFLDPCGNALEFKAFADIGQLFAK